MNRNNANTNYNNRYAVEQPNLSGINVGGIEELAHDEEGKIVNGLKVANTEVEHVLAYKAIRDFIIAKYKGPLGEEIKKLKVFKYAATNLVDDDDVNAIGDVPVPVDENQLTLAEKRAEAKYDRAIKRLENKVAADHELYRTDFTNAVAKVLQIYCSSSVRNAVEKDALLIEAQSDQSNMLNFLKVLEICVRKITNVGLTLTELRGRVRDAKKDMIKTLKVRDFKNGMLYLQELEVQIELYKKILLEEKVEKLSAILNAPTRAQRIREYTSDIETSVDQEEEFIQAIYWEVYNHALLPKYQSEMNTRATTSRCHGKRTPFSRKVVGLVITGGITNMLTEFLQIVSAETAELGQVVWIVKKKTEKKPLNVPDEPTKKIRINNQTVTTPCKYCLETLKFENIAKYHKWQDCFYNKDCKDYVGDEKKALKESKALFYQKKSQDEGRQRQSFKGRNDNSKKRKRGSG